VLSQKSLGVARNLGARMARGEVLMFLDADTTFPPNGLGIIARQFSSAHAAATLKGRPDSTRFAYRLLYVTKNIAHRWITRHGSSGVIICWKKDFVHVGGFDEGLEVRENSELIKRLKRLGRYKYIGKTVATTSMRRYEQRGFGHMIRLWTRLWWQSLFGDLHNRSYETVR
jgi:glycosyltransferase involved in cell wall biosynthesis